MKENTMKRDKRFISQLILLSALMGTLSCDPPPTSAPAEQAYEHLISDYIEAWKGFYPTSAARLGLDQYLSEAEDRSAESVRGWIELNSRVLEKIAAAPQDLPIDLLIDLRLLRSQAASELKEASELQEASGLKEGGTEFPLGRERYAEELRAYYDMEITPEEVADRALKEIEAVRELIIETSTEYWREAHAGEAVPTEVGELVARVSDDMEENRPSTQQESLKLFSRFAEEAEAFVRDREIATLPSDRTLEIVLTPESAGPAQRIGFVDSAPPFDPDPMTVLSLPTIPDSFPAEEKEDFYRSFNNHFNKFIIIHELFPGHYMQLKIASGNPRPIRIFFPYEPYIEGWATLVEKIALDAGWDDFNKLTYLAHLRKRLENANRAYTSVQIHCFGWGEEQVTRFSEEEALLAPQFAQSLWGRLERGPMQMTSYFMGKDMFMEILHSEMQRLGDGFEVRAFSDVILNAGAVPMDMLPKLLALAQPDR